MKKTRHIDRGIDTYDQNELIEQIDRQTPR